MKIALIDYGAGNLHSVANALREAERSKLLRMAQKVNHLTESLVNQHEKRVEKRRSESLVPETLGLAVSLN